MADGRGQPEGKWGACLLLAKPATLLWALLVFAFSSLFISQQTGAIIVQLHFDTEARPILVEVKCKPRLRWFKLLDSLAALVCGRPTQSSLPVLAQNRGQRCPSSPFPISPFPSPSPISNALRTNKSIPHMTWPGNFCNAPDRLRPGPAFRTLLVSRIDTSEKKTASRNCGAMSFAPVARVGVGPGRQANIGSLMSSIIGRDSSEGDETDSLPSSATSANCELKRIWRLGGQSHRAQSNTCIQLPAWDQNTMQFHLVDGDCAPAVAFLLSCGHQSSASLVRVSTAYANDSPPASRRTTEPRITSFW